MKRFLLNVSTEWCGEENTYAAYAKSEDELYELLDELSYENFLEFGGFEKVLEQLYPDVEGEYTEEMYNEAANVAHEYHFGDIEEWDETRSEEEWNDYELVRGDDEDDEEEYVEVEEEDDEDDIDEEEYDQ